MYLTDEDYKVVCGEQELDIITQSDNENRRNAERTAREEIASYLRARYDIEKEYALTGEERNAFLVQVAVNISLYYMVHSLPGHMASEGRHELYEAAISWLNKVQSGKAMPSLPVYTDSEGNETNASNPVRYGTMPRNKNDY